MKKYMLTHSSAAVLTGLMLACSVCADQPATTIPEHRLERDSWKARHEEKVQQAKSGSYDLVMIGDSITHSWEKQASYASRFEPYNTLNLGIGGDRTQHVLWRLQNGSLDGISPKLVTLMIGTNNIKHDQPEDVAAGIRAIVKELRTRFPEATIIVFSIFPRSHPRNPGDHEIVKAVNKLLPAIADNKQVIHVDINDRFLDENGQLRAELYGRDLLHLSSRGYDAWFEALKPIVASVLSEAGVD